MRIYEIITKGGIGSTFSLGLMENNHTCLVCIEKDYPT